MKGDAAHWYLVAFGQRDVEQLRPFLRVIEKHLVEITEPKEQQSIRRQDCAGCLGTAASSA
jgi:hypothetical protein